jgi:uncharacterized membrane protein
MTLLSSILSTVLMLIVVSIFVAFILISHAVRSNSEAKQNRALQRVRARNSASPTVTERRGELSE